MNALFEELDPETRFGLLREQSIGRLAIGRPDGPPHLVPVNYAVLHRAIVFRTTPGTKLDLLVTEPVSFEVDTWDPEGRSGWSVVVSGLAYEASDREMEYEHVSLDSVAEQQHSRWVRLVPESVTGRRVVRPPTGWQPPILIPDPGVEEWHGGGADRWATEWVQ
jgi:uncharacterized protein